MSDIFDKAFDISQQYVTKQFNCLIIKGYLINTCKIFNHSIIKFLTESHNSLSKQQMLLYKSYSAVSSALICK